MPPPDDYYLVREEQLDSLGEKSKDLSLEISMCATGAAAGFSQNFCSVIGKLLTTNGPPIELLESLLAFAFVGSVVLAITKFHEYKRRGNKSENTLTAIKSGQKAVIKHDG